jgi:glycosyltransferase involved in cell wall biosynthesis
MPLISIIIPVYNVENYICQCLDSVLSQTFSDYECILVDDGSHDNCPAICDEYADKDLRFRVIHKKNGGQADARNEGIKAAKGEYIVFLDSDDLFADNKALENIREIMETTKADLIYNSNLTTFRNSDFTSSDNFNKDFICGDTICFYKGLVQGGPQVIGGIWCFALHRDFLLRHDLFFKTGIVHEDEHWTIRIICAASRAAVNHNLFYAYRVERPGSTMNVVTPKRFFDMISIIEDIIGWLKLKDTETFHRQVYIDRGSYLLRAVLYQSTLLGTEYYQETILLLGKLKEYAPLLLRKMSVKNCVSYLLINFINLNYRKFMFCKKFFDIRRKILVRSFQ